MQPISLKNNAPSTYELTLLQPVNKIQIFDNKGRVYFYRDLPRGLRKVKVNIPDKGSYTIDAPVLIKQKPLEVTRAANKINFPRKERNRAKEYFFSYDPNETSSPALIYTDTGEIVRGRKFKELSIPMQVFILLHELGHFYYHTEEYCDLYALYHFIQMGYNPSTAMYCLLDQLRRNPMNDKRISSLYQSMLDTEIVK